MVSGPMQGRLDNASVKVFMISNSSHSQGRLMQNFEIDINFKKQLTAHMNFLPLGVSIP